MTGQDSSTETPGHSEENTDDALKEPSMYVVLVHNDPVAPRGFVVDVLRLFFRKTTDEATRIMLVAHTFGLGAVGVFTFEIAETKATAANSYARINGYPLQFSVQEQ